MFVVQMDGKIHTDPMWQAAVTIQKYVRGLQARRRYKQILIDREEISAAITIQVRVCAFVRVRVCVYMYLVMIILMGSHSALKFGFSS